MIKVTCDFVSDLLFNFRVWRRLLFKIYGQFQNFKFGLKMHFTFDGNFVTISYVIFK